MMHQCRLLYIAALLLLIPLVYSNEPKRRRGIPRPPWFPPTPSDENTQEDSPLESAPVPLPNLRDDDDRRSLFKFKRNKPSFDVFSLKDPVRRTKRQSKYNHGSKKQHRVASGSRFSIQLKPPSPERITRWFAPGEETIKKRSKAESGPFNHDSVGMTNPVLGMSSSIPSSNLDMETATSASSTSKRLELEDSLIPAMERGEKTHQSKHEQEVRQVARVLQYKLRSPETSDRQAAEQAWFPSTQQTEKTKNQWRQCRYRRRVGKGQACYERVREAALQWQFQYNQQPSEGILPVSTPDSSCFSLGQGASETVQPIWSGPYMAGSRRLVTFTTCGFKTKWLPKLYALNPVMVVYDVLDQRGPSTTYSSTAYATLQGHLISGEERVTVALRDDTEYVDVEILSYSRPGQSMRSKFVWPMIGRMQQRFFEHQMDYLEQVAKPKPPPPPPSSSSK